MRAKLDSAVVRTVEVQPGAAARPIRRVAVDGGRDAHLPEATSDPLRVVILHADADVIHGAWIRELVETKKPVAESESASICSMRASRMPQTVARRLAC